MRHDRASNDVRERAVLHALDLLERAEADDMREHLRAGCEVCAAEVGAFREVLAWLSLAPEPEKPDPSLRARLLARVAGEPQLRSVTGTDGPQAEAPTAASSGTPLLSLVRAGEGEWQASGIRGVQVKPLFNDPVAEQITMLVRMESGTSFPRHRHGGAEQCFVLEGDVQAGDLVLQAGDYQCAAPDTIHDVNSTRNGCLLLIVASIHDELVP